MSSEVRYRLQDMLNMQASKLVLHWGVRKGKKDWVLPPRDMWAANSKQAGDIAIETTFEESAESIEHAGSKIDLQRLEFDIEPSVQATGLTFVIRSDDNSAWYRDGENSSLSTTIYVALVIESWISESTFEATKDSAMLFKFKHQLEILQFLPDQISRVPIRTLGLHSRNEGTSRTWAVFA